MKIKAKTKDCQLIVKAKTSFGESIDDKELDRFSRVYLRGFLKPKQSGKNQVEYLGPVGISLYERLKKPILKRDLLFILEQIVVAVQKLQSNSLPLNNLIMDIHYAYMNEVTKEVQFIYLPILNSRDNTNLIDFVESVVYSLQLADEKDSDFVSRFIYFFKALSPLDVNKIEQFILKEDRSVVNTIKKQNAGQSGYMTDKHQDYYRHYAGREGDSEATCLLSQEDEATGLLDDDEATGILYDEEATSLLDDDENATMLLTEEPEYVHFPTLFRVSTEESISINKPVFRLGKEKSCADYFVADNVAVSRSHADIITRAGCYFVVDLNSKNHTYVNSESIPVQCEVELHDGDRLRLANEEFTFHV